MKQNLIRRNKGRSFIPRQMRQLSFFLGLVFLILPQLSRALTISGPTSVCVGNSSVYTVPSSTGIIYTWSAGAGGTIIFSTMLGGLSQGNMSWTAIGGTTVSVIGYDAADGTTVVESATLAVSVLPVPNPVLKWDVEVGCQVTTDTALQPGAPGKSDIDETVCVRVCEQSIVNYEVPLVSGSTYTWNVVGGTVVPSGNTSVVTWGTWGPGLVEVIETNAGGCIGKKTICFEIIKKPRAEFKIMSDPLAYPSVSACAFDNVVFKDFSVDNGGTELVSWYWDFGDLSSSSEKNPNHSYNSAGTYTVTLTVRNACNCSATYTMQVVVSALAGVKIICPGIVCENATAKYSVIDPCSSYPWSVSGGTIISGSGTNEISVQWNSVGPEGYGYVYFDASPCVVGCPAKTAIKVPVIKTAGTITGKTIICTDKQYRYTLPQWAACNYTWSISPSTATWIQTDQPNEVIVQSSTPGTITLTCNYSNNLLITCNGSASLAITVQAPPTISGSRKFCKNTTMAYSLSTGASGNWKIEGPSGTTTGTGTSISKTFSVSGTYRLSVEGSFCWPDPIEINVLAQPALPNAIKGPVEICPNTPTVFTAEKAEAGSIFVWSLTAGTGTFNTTTGSEVSFTGTGAGPWTFSVVRKSKLAPNCEGDPLTKTVSKPVISAVISGDVTPCVMTHFTYSVPYKNADNYEWLILPSTAGSVLAPNHTADPTILWNTTAGAAKICVKLFKCDSIYYDTLDVVIHGVPTPVVAFSSPVCAGIPVSTGLGTDLKGGMLTIMDWGDGSGVTDYPHKFVSGGTFTVKFLVENPEDCNADVVSTTSITVNPQAEINLTAGGPYCFPMAGPATLTTTLLTGTTAPYLYTLRPLPSGSPVSNPTGIFPVGPLPIGSYSYEVEIVDGNGCRSKSNIVVVKVNSCPAPPCGIAGILAQPTPLDPVANPIIVNCSGEGVLRVEESITKSSLIWELSDGLVGPIMITPAGTGSGTIITDYRFKVNKNNVGYSRGKYRGTFTSGGSICEKEFPFLFYNPMNVRMSKSIVCGTGVNLGKYVMTLTDLSEFHSSETPGVNEWTITPTIGTLLGSPQVVVLNPGVSYSITHRRTTASGANCSINETVSIPNLPNAAFDVEFTPTCSGTPVHFVNNSTPVGLEQYWSFGDLTYNKFGDREYTYKGPNPSNPYSVILTVTDAYGCTSFITDNVVVFQNTLIGKGVLSASPSLVCPNDPVTLSYSSLPGGSTPNTFIWQREKDVLLGTTTVGTYVLTAPKAGKYFAETHDINQCRGFTTGAKVDVVGIPDLVISGKNDVCAGEDFTLSAYAGGAAINYKWEIYNPGTSSWVTILTPPPIYDLPRNILTAGNYRYRVSIDVPKFGSGSPYCSIISVEHVVTVHAIPASPLIAYTMIDCARYELQLTASTGTLGTYTWSNGMSGSLITVTEGGPYRVYFKDAYGCRATAETDILKDPKSYLWIFPTGCYTLCPAPRFTLKGPIVPFDAWEWRRNYAPVSSGGPGFVSPYSISTSGVYNLHLDNGLCAATSGDLDFTASCAASDCSQWLSASLIGISYGIDCRATINLSLTYFGPPGLVTSYSITPSMGGYVSIVSAPPLPYSVPTSVMFNWIAPAPGGFPSGSMVEFIITINLPGGGVCYKKVKFVVNCPFGPVLHRATQEVLGEDVVGSMLKLAPNPAMDHTLISYRFGTGSSDLARSVLIYDMIGRVLGSYPVYKTEGDMDLHFGNWSSGLYRIVLLDGDKAVQTVPLTITR